MGAIVSVLSSFKKEAAILGVISLFLIIPVRFFLPELTESVFGLLILGLLLLLIVVIGAWKSILIFLVSKQARYGLNTLIIILLFAAVLILANILGILKQHRFDLTASGKFTLAPQTINIVKGLKESVKVLCFFPDEPAYEEAKSRTRELLEEYRYVNNKITFQFIDPEAKPALANKYKVAAHGTIIFDGLGRQKNVTDPTEQQFTNALLEISGIQAKQVYFLTGNGEHDLIQESDEGYGEARRGLIRDLYQVKTVNLTLTGDIPRDCAVLIMAGTKKDLPKETVYAIQAYLAKNGKVLMLIDPHPPKELKDLLAEWGLAINEGRVMDPGAYVSPDMAVPAVFKGLYPAVVITRGLDTTYFPEAVSFNLSSELSRVLEAMPTEGQIKTGWPLRPIQYQNLAILPALLSTPESWLDKSEKDPNRLEKNKGPQALGAMIIAGGPLGKSSTAPPSGMKDKLTRLVVIGDSDFASNLHIRNGGNGDLFLNAVNWLAEEENLISIRPKPYSFRKLLVNQNELRFIRYSSLVFLPLLMLILGGVIWWRKR
jgi:ABC-type uncharacterized transport system involved in gliding motility auxiliary subunit